MPETKTLEELTKMRDEADLHGDITAVDRLSKRMSAVWAAQQPPITGTSIFGVPTRAPVPTDTEGHRMQAPAARDPGSRLPRFAQLGNQWAANLAGTPVDFAQNVWNLAGAAGGTAAHAMGAPWEAIDQVVDPNPKPWPMGSEWMKEQMGTAAGRPPQGLGEELAVNAPNALMGRPQGLWNLLKHLAATEVPTAAAHGAGAMGGEGGSQALAAGGAQALQTLASRRAPTMRSTLGGGPQAAAETARQQRAGVQNPSAAAVAGPPPQPGQRWFGNPTMRAMDALTANLPGGDMINQQAQIQREEQVGARTQNLAERVSPTGHAASAEQAGGSLAHGFEKEKGRIAGVQDQLFGAIVQKFPLIYVGLPNYEALLRKMTEPPSPHSTPAEIELANAMRDPQFKKLLDDVEKVIQERKIGTQSTLLGPDGKPLFTKHAQVSQHQNAITFRAADQLRQQIGARMNDHLTPTGSKAAYKALEAAILTDMEGALPKGSRERHAWERARTYTRIAHSARLDPMERHYGKGTKEEILRSALGGTKDGAGRLRQVMKSATEDGRNTVRSYIIDNLGRAKPGAAGGYDQGTFSFDTFVTNWKKLHPDVKEILFGGKENPGLREAMDDISRTSERYSSSGGLLYNPAGTGRNRTWADTAMRALSLVGGGAVGTAAGAMGGHPVAGAVGGAALGGGAGIAGEIYGSRAVQKLMTNPKFVTWLGKADVPPERRIQYLAQLQQIAQQTNDAEERKAIIGVHDFLMRQERQRTKEGAARASEAAVGKQYRNETMVLPPGAGGPQ